MGLPQQVLSSPAIPSAFLPPKDAVKQALRDYFSGGNGISDASAGLNTQTWVATTDGLNIYYFSPLSGTTLVKTVAVAIVWLTAAFDQSMRPLIAWTDSAGASYYYWYDTLASAFATTALAAGTITPYATLDDRRSQELNINDGLITYVTAGGSLRFLQQRDRFGVEYVLGNVPAPSPTFGAAQLTQVGMNLNFRMQYQFQYPGLGLDAWPPVLLSNLVGAIPRIWPLEDDITARSPSARIEKP